MMMHSQQWLLLPLSIFSLIVSRYLHLFSFFCLCYLHLYSFSNSIILEASNTYICIQYQHSCIHILVSNCDSSLENWPKEGEGLSKGQMMMKGRMERKRKVSFFFLKKIVDHFMTIHYMFVSQHVFFPLFPSYQSSYFACLCFLLLLLQMHWIHRICI